MKVWRRAEHPMLCGGWCGKTIAKGDPIMVLELVGLKARPRRCVACAGEPVPEHLAPLTEAAKTTIEPTPLYRGDRVQIGLPTPSMRGAMEPVGVTAADWKHKQAGDRQPGEDDA